MKHQEDIIQDEFSINALITFRGSVPAPKDSGQCYQTDFLIFPGGQRLSMHGHAK